MSKGILTSLLLLSFTLCACAVPTSKVATNLMDDIQKSDLAPIEISDQNEGANRSYEITDLALTLFRESFEDENILISPLSITSALGMVANGADGDTLSQMEQVLNSDIQGLNDYLKAYAAYLLNSDKYKVSLANSIWFRDIEDLMVNQKFLQSVKDYYDAGVYKAPFDKTTKDDINSWVKNETSGLIESLLDEAPSDQTMMYLINALAFDAEWAIPYEETRIHDGEFTLENGEKQSVELMSSTEISYLENDMLTGFMKPYEGNKYAFVALLPKEEISMLKLLDSLEAKDLMGLIENKKHEEVYTEIPKFSVTYDTMLNEPLKNLGLLDAFDPNVANLTGLGRSTEGNLFISRVIHKTRMDVDEKGTKAGAVTAVEVDNESMMEEVKEVILNRPFFYMVVDTEHNFPLFMGSLMSVN